jgi:hypothetical protein
LTRVGEVGRLIMRRTRIANDKKLAQYPRLGGFADMLNRAWPGSNVDAWKVLSFDKEQAVLHARALAIAAAGGDVSAGLAEFVRARCPRGGRLSRTCGTAVDDSCIARLIRAPSGLASTVSTAWSSIPPCWWKQTPRFSRGIQSDVGRVWLSCNDSGTRLSCDNSPRASQANSPNFRMRDNAVTKVRELRDGRLPSAS